MRPQGTRSKPILCVSLLLVLAGLLVGCGGDADADPAESSPMTGKVLQTITIEDNYPNSGFDAADEQEAARLIENFVKSAQRVAVTFNSVVLANLRHTPPDTMLRRAQASLDAIESWALASQAMADFEETRIMPVVDALKAKASEEPTSETAALTEGKADGPTRAQRYHARKLIDLYMNDDQFYQNVSLAKISARTNVSRRRLHKMMEQAVDVINAEGYAKEDDLYAKYEKNMRRIRDTSFAAAAVVATVASGGAAAGAVGTLGKAVVVVEKISVLLTATEVGKNVIEAALGDDATPTSVNDLFTANKVLTYALSPKGLIGGGAGAFFALTTPLSDAEDTWITPKDDGTIDISDGPRQKVDPRPEEPTVAKAAEALLPAGEYLLTDGPPKTPEDSTTFRFDNTYDPFDEAAWELESQKLEDLLDMPSATTDELSYDPDAHNPPESLKPIFSTGLGIAAAAGGDDPVLTDPSLASPAAVVLKVTPATGPAPLQVDFAAELADPNATGLTYAWDHGDGATEEGTLASTLHTYDTAGTFQASVRVRGEDFGVAEARVEVVVSEGSTPADRPDAGGGGTAPEGASWTDPDTGLEWQNAWPDGHQQFDNPLTSELLIYTEAVAYCDALNLNGGGWRLPDLDEARSFIRGCKHTVAGGACGVTVSCNDSSSACWCKGLTPEECRSTSGQICGGCRRNLGPYHGPPTFGCYWDADLWGDCKASYWTSTPAIDTATPIGSTEPAYVPARDEGHWTVHFRTASIGTYEDTDDFVMARCVR
jgi:hypothetical protein